MYTLALAMLSKPSGTNLIRTRADAAIRYRLALRELRRLDAWDLDELGFGRRICPSSPAAIGRIG